MLVACNVDCYFQHEGFCCEDAIDLEENDTIEVITEECNNVI